jgi:hypothetical protein
MLRLGLMGLLFRNSHLFCKARPWICFVIVILLRDALVFHANEPLDFCLPETPIRRSSEQSAIATIRRILVHQIYSHRHHSQDMDEALFIPHLAVGHTLRENPAPRKVHALVLTLRALSTTN